MLPAQRLVAVWRLLSEAYATLSQNGHKNGHQKRLPTAQPLCKRGENDALTPDKSGTFSPLFIGEDSSTTDQHTWTAGNYEPFSPLFIGEDSSTFDVVAVAALQKPFSPLFIGEDSSTAWDRIKSDASNLSFSPLFIGEDSSTPFVVYLP
jgi:hypothetical protein